MPQFVHKPPPHQNLLDGMESLQKTLVRRYLPPEAQQQFSQGKIAQHYLKSFSKAIVALSEGYTRQTALQTISKQEMAVAYAFYFGLVNYWKVGTLLYRAGLSSLPIQRVLDYGCGTGAGALAAATVFSQVQEVSLVDASSAMRGVASELVRHLYPTVAQSVNDEGKYDCIIAANVLNELSLAEAQKKLVELTDKLTDAGVLVCVEPALQVTTRNLMQLRDVLLATAKDLAVQYPCPHDAACPMLQASTHEWCHGELSWEMPQLVRQLDELTGFNKHTMKYAAVIFKRGGVERHSARVVFPPQFRKKTWHLTTCCEGVLLPIQIEGSKRDKVVLHSGIS